MKKTLVFLVVFIAFNCKANKESTKMENTDMTNEKFNSNLIAKGNLFGSGTEGIEKQNLVITNEDDWNSLLSQMNSVNTVTDSFSETKVDFLNYIIIAIFNEVKTTGGHNIELDISTTSQNTLVKVNYVGPKGIATSVMTQPFYIVKILKHDLPIVFQYL